MARKIKRRIPAYISVSYQCETCKKEYQTPTKAEKCEAMLVEEKKFNVGDQVSWREIKQCGRNGRDYFIKATVVIVVGPVLPDYEYNSKWLGGRLSGLHAFEYVLEWNCPHCKQSHQGTYYSPELIQVSDELPFTNCKKMEQFMRRNGMYTNPD